MTELDRKIEEALDTEDRVLFDQLGDQGLIGQARTVFQGKMRWLSVASLILGTLLNIAFFYAAWKFFVAAGVDDRVVWGGVAWFLATMVAFMKVWFWLRMESNRVLREIKRVELQLARMQQNQRVV